MLLHGSAHRHAGRVHHQHNRWPPVVMQAACRRPAEILVARGPASGLQKVSHTKAGWQAGTEQRGRTTRPAPCPTPEICGAPSCHVLPNLPHAACGRLHWLRVQLVKGSGSNLPAAHPLRTLSAMPRVRARKLQQQLRGVGHTAHRNCRPSTRLDRSKSAADRIAEGSASRKAVSSL